jgi:hypothetical protein
MATFNRPDGTAAVSAFTLGSEPELMLVTPDARTRRFNRDDLVVRKGEIALINDNFTPQESMVKDLLAVRDALEAAGVEFLLVRGDGGRPVIAVDRKRRKTLTKVLAEAFANEPFYAKPPSCGLA